MAGKAMVHAGAAVQEQHRVRAPADPLHRLIDPMETPDPQDQRGDSQRGDHSKRVVDGGRDHIPRDHFHPRIGLAPE